MYLLHQLILSTSPMNNNATISFFYFLYTITSSNGVGSNFSSTLAMPAKQQQQRRFSYVSGNHPLPLAISSHAERELIHAIQLMAFASRGKNGLGPFQPSPYGWARSSPF
jgi:hypothetical protein